MLREVLENTLDNRKKRKTKKYKKYGRFRCCEFT